MPIQMADARAFTTVTWGRMRPPFSATANMTSGTPWPRASWAKAPDKRTVKSRRRSGSGGGTRSRARGSAGSVPGPAVRTPGNQASHVMLKISQRNATAPGRRPPRRQGPSLATPTGTIAVLRARHDRMTSGACFQGAGRSAPIGPTYGDQSVPRSSRAFVPGAVYPYRRAPPPPHSHSMSFVWIAEAQRERTGLAVGETELKLTG